MSFIYFSLLIALMKLEILNYNRYRLKYARFLRSVSLSKIKFILYIATEVCTEVHKSFKH